MGFHVADIYFCIWPNKPISIALSRLPRALSSERSSETVLQRTLVVCLGDQG